VKNLSKILKNAREKMGLSQEQLTEKVGFTNKTSICHIERGRRDIPEGRRRAYLLAVGLRLRDVEKPIKDDLWKGWIKK